MNQEIKPTTVYFDRLCPICSREIEHYRKQKGSENLRFIDITDPRFDPAHEGVDAWQVNKVMHVRDDRGIMQKGLSAFITIWEVLPRYQWLAHLAKIPFIRPVLELAYAIFARIRPYLRKKSSSCNHKKEH